MSSFADLHLDERVLSALSDIGYESPSPIQAETIPPLIDGRDVLGLAQTGTGKTAAFALPILSRIDAELRAPQALVLTPTRELAIQVAEAFQRYASKLPDFHVLPIYGGQSYGPQLHGLRRGAHVVVGTPGRLIDHLERGSMDPSSLTHVVLDEADEMLRMGFLEEVEKILQLVPSERQTALFSATMPRAVHTITQSYLRDPVEIRIESKTSTVENTTQKHWMVSGMHKLDALTRILEVEKFDAMLIFVRTKQATEELAERLRARGFSAQAINGDIAQTQRERTIGQLRDGNLDILVATDVAARGLDVERVTHVLNYDIPHDPESYVHRIGRTGRAGRSGTAILFVAPRERHLLRSIERATRQPIELMELPSVEAVNDQRITRFAQSITDTLAAGELDVFRKVVEDYEREHNVPAVEIAAALARMARGDRALLMEPPPPMPARSNRPERRGRDDREDRPPKRKRPSDPTKELYRVSVGRAHQVRPNSIVGAITGEGGLDGDDIGHIDIRQSHTFVELPADLPKDVLRRLQKTRVAGQALRIGRADEPRDRPMRPSKAGRTSRDSAAPRKDKSGPRKEKCAAKKDKKPRH